MSFRIILIALWPWALAFALYGLLTGCQTSQVQVQPEAPKLEPLKINKDFGIQPGKETGSLSCIQLRPDAGT
jgi:hypothetical protein